MLDESNGRREREIMTCFITIISARPAQRLSRPLTLAFAQTQDFLGRPGPRPGRVVLWGGRRGNILAVNQPSHARVAVSSQAFRIGELNSLHAPVWCLYAPSKQVHNVCETSKYTLKSTVNMYVYMQCNYVAGPMTVSVAASSR